VSAVARNVVALPTDVLSAPWAASRSVAVVAAAIALAYVAWAEATEVRYVSLTFWKLLTHAVPL
jgi:hypothetical protein